MLVMINTSSLLLASELLPSETLPVEAPPSMPLRFIVAMVTDRVNGGRNILLDD